MSLAAVLSRALVLTAAWWVLAEGRVDSPGIAALTIVLAVATSMALSRQARYGLSWPAALAFAAFFLVESVKAGVQVARIALRPRLVLDPALVRVPLTLPPGLPQVLLMNTLTLLPGTLSVRVDGASLCLHVLDRRQPVEASVRAAEARIARMLEIGR